MSNIIRLDEMSPNDEWIVMSNQGTDCFLDLLIVSAEGFERTEHQNELISFLKDRRDINDIAPGTAGFDLDEMPWREETLKDDAGFLLCVAREALSGSVLGKTGIDVSEDIVFPWLERFCMLIGRMTAETERKTECAEVPGGNAGRGKENEDR